METKRFKILAIDDNPDNLLTLKAIVNDVLPGTIIFTALNGLQGIEFAKADDPDVILLDIIMPGMDGFEVCRILKEDVYLQMIPVLFLTALKTDREIRFKAIEAGAEAFLSKPFDEMELMAQIQAMAKIKERNVLLSAQKDQLEALVAQRTYELKQEIIERKKTENQVRTLNESLKQTIDEQKKMELQLKKQAVELEQKSKLVTDFFINISHELKTPITLIMLALEIIENYQKQTKLNRAGIMKRTAIMKQNAYRLSRLVGNILDITKIDAGFMEPKLANIDILFLLSDLVDSMESYAAKRGLHIKFKSSAKKKLMLTDSQIVERIILNLVSNAIKHTQEGGSINVNCLDVDDKIIISVKDNGEGIPEDKKAFIFDRFRQVNTSLARTSEGSGIGLSLTKSLVEMLDGRIWFESTLGAGSEFFVELPVLQMEEQHQPIEQHGMAIDKRIQMEFSDIIFS